MFDARVPARLLVVFQVMVWEGDKPPDQSEDNPAKRESHGKNQQVPAPLDVDHCGEDVGQKAATSLVNVHSRYVAFAVLTHKSALRQARQQPPKTLLAKHRRHLSACTIMQILISLKIKRQETLTDLMGAGQS